MYTKFSCLLNCLHIARRNFMTIIQQGLIQDVIDRNAAAIGRHYRVTVAPDPHGGSCEVGLVLEPR